MRNSVLLISSLLFLIPSTSADDWVFPKGAVLEELWNNGDFTEGVAVRRDGQVFFSDILRDPKKAWSDSAVRSPHQANTSLFVRQWKEQRVVLHS